MSQDLFPDMPKSPHPMIAWMKQHDITITQHMDCAYDPPLVTWIATKIQPVSTTAPTKGDALIMLAAKLEIPTWH